MRSKGSGNSSGNSGGGGSSSGGGSGSSAATKMHQASMQATESIIKAGSRQLLLLHIV